jgi:hypothetical protein
MRLCMCARVRACVLYMRSPLLVGCMYFVLVQFYITTPEREKREDFFCVWVFPYEEEGLNYGG